VNKSKIVLVVHNIRSALNVGSLLRTADGLGVEMVYLTGYSPYPEARGDVRLPHVRLRATKQIRKTALGAEETVKWAHYPGVSDLIDRLKENNFTVVALEQTKSSQKLPDFKLKGNSALIVGNEVDGLDEETLSLVDSQVEIPMLGQKESFNVAVAAAIALYHLRFTT